MSAMVLQLLIPKESLQLHFILLNRMSQIFLSDPFVLGLV